MTSTIVRAPSRRLATVGLVVALVVVSVVATVTFDPAPAAAAAPTPTPARVGPPTSMAALGDSITQATGTGALSVENPKNSWSTGWEVSSVRARLGITQANARNLSANGARMGDADAQVLNGRDGQSLDPNTQYVTIEMGGNDLCRDSVADMTSTTTYRTHLREALAAIRTRAPGALVFVMSVPDIYNLWYIRGAVQNGTYHPEPESDQANGLNGARFYWGQSFFPCQSLLTNPDSYAQVDRDRRAAVRQRTLDYNAALRAECATWLRCRYDGERLFNLTSNRVNPPNGPVLAHGSWAFTDADISRNEGVGRYLCPVQGVFAGGCGDHFHPSKAGQGKLADSATVSSYQWSDAIAPTAGAVPSPAARSDGTFRGPVSVSFTGTDVAGVRGQEVRLHRPDGSVSAWDPSIGLHAPLTLTDVGQTYVEVRSLDVNGNQSKSTILGLNITTNVPGATAGPTLTVPSGTSVRVTWTAPADDGGSPLTGYDVERRDASGTSELTSVGPVTTAVVPATPAQVATVRVRARNAVGVGPWSASSAPALPPFATVGAFLTRAYGDLALRAPTATEATTATTALVSGEVLPAKVVTDLVAGPTWEPVIAPVTRMYRAYFLRFPEADGLSYWEGRVRGGLSINAMSQLFTGTAEFRRLYGNLSNQEFVRRVYRNVLEREAEPAGLEYWTNELDSGRYSRGRMMTFYSESAENRSLTVTTVVPITVYWGLLDRLPTGAEQTAAAAILTGGFGTRGLVAQVLTTPEWADHVT